MDVFKKCLVLPELGRDLSVFTHGHVVSKQIRLSNWTKETELFFGIDHSRLFVALQHKLLSVLKAILLEAKILVRSLDFSKAISAVGAFAHRMEQI